MPECQPAGVYVLGEIDETVTLWHGTTSDRAENIARSGFQPINLASELREVAERYGVTVGVLTQALADHSRFAVIQHVRSELTWLAVSIDNAMRWAARAPEARWEALWGVWWVTRDTDDPTPWRTPQAAAWHAQQFFGVTPAVIELGVPVSCVLDGHGQAVTPETVRDETQLDAAELSIWPPGDARWVKHIQRTRRPVEFTAVAGLLGVSLETLSNLVEEEQLPEPRPNRPGMDWIWFEDELHSFVPHELLERPI